MKPTIRLPQAIALYIGAVLGAGILIVPGLAAELAGPASLIDWGILLILVIPLALCMAFLAQKYPNSGGVAYFVTQAFGRRLGTVIGWFFLMSVPIGAPVAALTGAGYLAASLRLSEAMGIILACVMLLIAFYLNHVGMRLAGKVQIIVVSAIVGLLIITIIGALPLIKDSNFEPFITHGARGIGRASTILFWCFIGWEAVSHLSSEFVNPDKDVVRATIISAVIIGILYFLNAYVVIGTDSYQMHEEAALVAVAKRAFGTIGAVCVGAAGFLICLATVITYIGAASRLARTLADQGNAPRWLACTSSKYKTPTGGLLFLMSCFALILTLYSTRILNLAQLIQLPNATFLLNYLGGCAAGVVLFRGDKSKMTVSIVSFAATLFMCLFLGWALLYPAAVLLFTFFQQYVLQKYHSKTHASMKQKKKSTAT
ncbi:amino acid permease [Sporolactobacillus sp. CPB3-1]|uniref:Amino acid permease n=1 Tax=Sporolactobacillus mangiferae TaxID=2940498 RepID=A0ABT0M7I3_9BACL|nr:amino acid permease [Sporolactobacillus mangiferae]MCL1630355.1 amino acid permease [Sporolactobacillus mangiferae]